MPAEPEFISRVSADVRSVLPLVAVAAFAVMGILDLLKDLGLRRVFYEVTLGRLSSFSRRRGYDFDPLVRGRELYSLRVTNFVAQLGIRAQRAVEEVPLEQGRMDGRPFSDNVLRFLLGSDQYSRFLSQGAMGQREPNEAARANLLAAIQSALDGLHIRLTSQWRLVLRVIAVALGVALFVVLSPALRPESSVQRLAVALTFAGLLLLSSILAMKSLGTAMERLFNWLEREWSVWLVAILVVLVFTALMTAGFAYMVSLFRRVPVVELGATLAAGLGTGMLAGIYHDVVATIRSLRRDS